MFESLLLLLKVLGIEFKFLFAGLFGAIVSVIISKKPFTWETVTTMLVGMLFAIYVTPAVVAYVGVALLDPNIVNALAFMFGLLGLRLAEAISRIANNFLANPGLPRNFLEFVVQYLQSKASSEKVDASKSAQLAEEQRNDEADTKDSEKPNN